MTVSLPEAGTGPDAPKQSDVSTRPPKQEPPRSVRRPPEPVRPEPALKPVVPGVTLLAAKARRRRYRNYF
jgi:hypothetical protein